MNSTTDHPAPTSDVAFSPAVKQAQQQRGSRQAYARMEQRGGWQSTITDDLAEFISQRDSLYLGTSSRAGQPYIQHRGGPRGFLKILDEQTLALADFAGNSQYISVGNLDENDQAFLFLMDYPRRRRIKIWGTARYVEDDPELLDQLTDPGYRGRPERAIVFRMRAWDINCPQHIQPRWSEAELPAVVEPVVAELRQRIAELEQENQTLRELSGKRDDDRKDEENNE